jgi:hypothetical protein
MIGRRLLGAALLWPTAAGACTVRKRASVALTIAGGKMLVSVTVNGIEGIFVLDTGAAATVVTPAAVDRFGLALDEWTATTMRGIGGVERHRNAIPRSIALGPVPLRRRSLAADSTLRVANLPRMEFGGGAVDGLLGRDFLSSFDLDLDPRDRSLALYEVRGCTDRFIPWPDPYVAIPFETGPGQAIEMAVELDGVPLRAQLDTGSGRTLLSAAGMVHLGLELDALADDPTEIVAGLGPHPVAMRLHVFRALRVGGQIVAGPTLLVAPVYLNPIGDLLLGADWALGRRLWISWSTGRIFAPGLP